MRVLLFGTGEMGSRHLQGLSHLPPGSEILALEPRDDARALALSRWQAMPGHERVSLRFDATEALPEGFDAAILATAAPTRLAQLRRVLAAGIRHVLAEKVLFQSVANYRAALEMARQAGADVRAHVPLRYVPVLQALRTRIDGRPFTLDVTVGNRGMGCNAIHFLDLFQFLAGQPPTEMTAVIDRPVQPNRRDAALVEFTGVASARTATGAQARIAFVPDHERLAVLTLDIDGRRTIIDQAGPVTSDDAALAGARFEMPMASAMTAGMIRDIQDGVSVLPDLAEGFEANRLMLDAYNRALTGHHADDQTCPIT